MERVIFTELTSSEIFDYLRSFEGYLLTNNERDVSQSDFQGRIMPWTTLRVAPFRDEVGYFAFEISGGASVHMDLMKKQINPFEKLRLIRKAMPNTLIQAVCRGHNLFGYRPYPENVIRFAVRLFAQYVDIWRCYDFMNHMDNLKVVGEEVIKAGKIFAPSLCFGIGIEHTKEFYLSKVDELVNAFGDNIILYIKNHSALGTPEVIADLVKAIKHDFPQLVLGYHGHNTDGNDLARMMSAVRSGVKIVEVADHGLGGWYSQAPALSFVYAMEDYGYSSKNLNIEAMIKCSDILREERRYYERFESPFKGVDPLVRIHRLTGGAVSMLYEQAEKVGLMSRINEVVQEVATVIKELGNIWPVTPGSQIFWSTALSNILYGRYEQPSDDLKRLLLGYYGPFPFYDPPEWIFEKVLEKGRTDGKRWFQILNEESPLRNRAVILKQENIKAKRSELEKELGRTVSDEELCLYLMFPRDALNYFKFEDKFGKTWLLPPSVWYNRGRFQPGTTITFEDDKGKSHYITIVSTQEVGGVCKTSCIVDYHFKTISVPIN